MQTKKLGFLAVFSIVIGSQIGTGVLMLPAGLAPFGKYSFLGWIISAVGAIFLSLIFSKLTIHCPKTGGPHTYIHKAFGERSAFIAAWSYWVISWISTAAVVIACIGYLIPLIGPCSAFTKTILQTLLLLSIVFINLKGVSAAGSAEVFLTSLKFIPLFIVPLICLFFFSPDNITVLEQTSSSTGMILKAVVLTMWGFIGVEAGTTPAESVENPSKTIPKAIVLGTVFVAALYIFNSLGVMGSIPAKKLANSDAPYVDAVNMIFHSPICAKIISLISAIICIGTLNAWTISASQVCLGASQDGFFPGFLQKKNKDGAPLWSIMASSFGMIPLFFMTMHESLSNQILDIIDISVSAFIFIYLFCALALFKILKEEHKTFFTYLIIAGGIGFCIFVLWTTPLINLVISSALPLSGFLLSFIKGKKIDEAKQITHNL